MILLCQALLFNDSETLSRTKLLLLLRTRNDWKIYLTGSSFEIFDPVVLYRDLQSIQINIYTMVFCNLWDPLRELIVRLKVMEKSHINICPILSLFMRYNEFSVFYYFYKRCSKWPPCIWRQACTHLVTLSIVPGFSNLSEALLYSISQYFSMFNRCCVHDRF